MNINNNLSGMLSAQMQIDKNAQTIASSTKSVADVQNPENIDYNSEDFTNAVVDQIPQVIAYKANANGIKTQDEIMGTLLDIKA